MPIVGVPANACAIGPRRPYWPLPPPGCRSPTRRRRRAPGRNTAGLRRAGDRVRFRRQRHGAPAHREGLPGRHPRDGSAVDRRGLRQPGQPRRDVGTEVRHVRADALQPGRQAGPLQRCGRGRRIAHLCQHPLRAPRRLLRGPGLGPHHRLAHRAGALLLPGPPDAGREHQPAPVAPRSGAARGRHRPRGGRHLRPHRCRGALRRGEPRWRHPRPLLRWCRARAQRLHPLRAMHDRVPVQREEHAAQELPPPGRAGLRTGAPPQRGRRCPPPARGRLPCHGTAPAPGPAW